MKKGFDFFAVLLFSAVIMETCGCGAGRIPMPEHRPVITGELDPFSFGDEFAFPPKAAVKIVSENFRNASRESFVSEKADSLVSRGNADGVFYRVQIGIFEDRDSAERRAEDARAKVDRSVYVEFEPPFFRVRVGDFTTRKEADAYVKILQDSGFRGSFWIMKNVRTP